MALLTRGTSGPAVTSEVEQGGWSMRGLRRAALALAVGSQLVACGTNGGSHDESRGTANGASTRTEPSPTVTRISTSSWRPGDPARSARLGGILRFTPSGCPDLGTGTGWVWPAGFTSVVKPAGERVIVTADGREMSAGDRVVAGGSAAGTHAKPGMPCIEPGTVLTHVQSEVEIIPSS